MNQKAFSKRLAELRMQKNVSARDMSLSIGQSENYINTIEREKGYPKMENFFNICEYLNITPAEFFDEGNKYPEHMKQLIEDLKHLDAKQLEMISALVQGLR